MGLTISNGPLAPNPPDTVNYAIDGPAHKLFFSPFPRTVRAELAGEVVLDTDAGVLLHETAILPQLYVPEADVRGELLQPSAHHTHCPFKGEASYHTIRVGEAVRENGVWSYLEPLEAASWLRGYRALYWDAADAWYDEDERVHGHLRDPFHRVDARPSRHHVRVLHGDEVIAHSDHPIVLSETGLPNRWYLPPDDLGVELAASATTTVCPYKGDAVYGSLSGLDDAAWSYPQPMPEVGVIAGLWSFDDTMVTVEVA